MFYFFIYKSILRFTCYSFFKTIIYSIFKTIYSLVFPRISISLYIVFKTFYSGFQTFKFLYLYSIYY